jgi:hypothetical protein
MAKAIRYTLSGHAITYANVRRYVTRDRLAFFSIRRSTPIHESDWENAMKLAREERTSRITTTEKNRELLDRRKLEEKWKRLKKLQKLQNPPPLISTGKDD